MRKLVLGLTALALVAAPAASAATRTVQITRSGFVPSVVTIATGDRVTWRNSDTRPHQVVADNGTFASPILNPGRSFTFTFTAAGTYRYRDTFNPRLRGTVRVTGPPPSVSAAVSRPIVYYGQQIHVTGTVSNRRAGETVTVYARPYPQASFSEVTSVLTTTGGVFDLVTTPAILTEYHVRWRSTASVVVRTEVKPRLTIRYARSSRIFTATARAGRSLGGRTVYLQRLSRYGQWVNVKRVKLNAVGSKRFRASLPRGRSQIRIFITVNQAGPGYLASWSNTWVVTRR